MKAYENIKQRSDEWHTIKWGKIGGTLSKGLFTKGDTLFIDILSQRSEEYEPSEGFTSAAMERGINLEPFAVDYLYAYTGKEFKEFGWLQSKANELLGISPDGLTADHKDACEIKCLGRKGHTSILLENDIPLEHIFQCVHYFTVNPELERLHFFAFRPESVKSFVKVLTLESIVNIGTKSRPQNMTIEAARDYAIEKADELLNRIINTNLKF